MAIAIVAFCFLGSEIAAQPRAGTTEWLYEECRSSDAARQDRCSAFLLGVAGTMEILGNFYENPPAYLNKEIAVIFGPLGICSTPISGADVREAFVNWAEKHPDKWSARMPQSAMSALQATWPCTVRN